ncbi:DUF7344 domain-containing protein [Natronolimnobius baerhuensis]|uniref:DUF7344 domain-containing protein n=1 Tax=Natronolimnobius baerhuensis TaxID=253108 RepID=A0A202EAP8_9EURY|nr:hypothetical protein [Natronolimnobius baerhuensis]OVE85309.1 hypothetical protein B2G88_00310 [Natronolimnobius baerhuensis]
MTAHACQTELGTEVDQLLDVLSNRLRRAVIYYFEVQIDRTVESLSALATYLSKTIPELATNTAEVELVHTHLPMLNARGWLEFDSRTETVVYIGTDRAGTLLADLREMFTSEVDDEHT